MAFQKRNAGTGDPGAPKICSRQNEISHSRNHLRIQEPSTLPDLWTYIGQEPIGRMYSGPDGFGAFSDAGDYIGSFTTTAAARSAIWEHHVGEDAGLERMAA